MLSHFHRFWDSCSARIPSNLSCFGGERHAIAFALLDWTNLEFMPCNVCHQIQCSFGSNSSTSSLTMYYWSRLLSRYGTSWPIRRFQARSPLNMGLRCNGSMFVHLPYFFARLVKVEISRWTQDARSFTIAAVEIHIPNKLVDQAALPCHFLSSPDSKHDQRLDSNSLADGAPRIELCAHTSSFWFCFDCVLLCFKTGRRGARPDCLFSDWQHLLHKCPEKHFFSSKKNAIERKHSNLLALPSDASTFATESGSNCISPFLNFGSLAVTLVSKRETTVPSFQTCCFSREASDQATLSPPHSLCTPRHTRGWQCDPQTLFALWTMRPTLGHTYWIWQYVVLVHAGHKTRRESVRLYATTCGAGLRSWALWSRKDFRCYAPPNAVEPCLERKPWRLATSVHLDMKMIPPFHRRERHALFWKHLLFVFLKMLFAHDLLHRNSKLTREVVEFRPFNETLLRSFSEMFAASGCFNVHWIRSVNGFSLPTCTEVELTTNDSRTSRLEEWATLRLAQITSEKWLRFTILERVRHDTSLFAGSRSSNSADSSEKISSNSQTLLRSFVKLLLHMIHSVWMLKIVCVHLGASIVTTTLFVNFSIWVFWNSSLTAEVSYHIPSFGARNSICVEDSDASIDAVLMISMSQPISRRHTIWFSTWDRHRGNPEGDESGSPESACVKANLRSQGFKSLFWLRTCGRGSLGKKSKTCFFLSGSALTGCCNHRQSPAWRPCRECCLCSRCTRNAWACPCKRWMQIEKKKTTSNFLLTQRETLLAWVLKPKKEIHAGFCWCVQMLEKYRRGLCTVCWQ